MGTGGSEKLEDEDNGTFPGLIPLIQEYLRNIEVDADTMCTLSRYFKVSKHYDYNLLVILKIWLKTITNDSKSISRQFFSAYSLKSCWRLENECKVHERLRQNTS